MAAMATMVDMGCSVVEDPRSSVIVTVEDSSKMQIAVGKAVLDHWG